ncbi:SGNH/GDSL hydrolase family protein [Blastococcus sp. CCUG 61487]|uniref:SGNH/GDSL hydrolase family protein n=1 Tax=Blastococcus sp. CCUG 61487 TaxID=1840703 RepID=UPI0010C0C464|nr:SGNH/GDSL hydrolase family protein [Blastococcus sp. CCUG 61487]TKJ23142.1 hypothetical protein A6V29_05640 [Blastococcus sp. CCUG 61487]
MPSRTEGLVVLAILLVMAIAVGVSAWVASNRTPPSFDPPAAAAQDSPEEPADRPVLAFYGDFLTSGTEYGGLGPAGWPALVSERLDAVSTPLHAVPEAGYVAGATTGSAFPALVERFPEPDADVTIVFGSRNDYVASPQQITAAATRTIEAILAAAPDTQVVVIGPAWTDVVVPPELPRVRDAVQLAAYVAGATWVDPLSERWFFDDAGLIATDAISPTDAGHVFMADQIEPVLRALLEGDAGATAGSTAGPTAGSTAGTTARPTS